MENIHVTLYGASWCPHCIKAKEWLEENKHSYTFKDVDQVENRNVLQANDVQGIPFMVVDKDDKKSTIQGFSPGKMSYELSK
ncbi:glutaredoxin family protein [Pontibacillus halophilus]|uniref:glutaredoxin family protein n=1 Tax=Pontibacillus halophilus TaxID=516704 RepID=UPI0003FB2E6A|nr:glutaredoxin family protein [Pontibacillus halophilus]